MQYPGCLRYARYGPHDEPLIACQNHKRLGQYTTNRHGVLLIATRDGKGKDTEAVIVAVALLEFRTCFKSIMYTCQQIHNGLPKSIE